MNNNKYDTLSEAVERLKLKGYRSQFSVNKDQLLHDEKSDENFRAEEVSLREFHRFEGMTNPGDSSIIYALETQSGVKGTLIDAYGVDNSMDTAEFIKKIEESRATT